MIEKQELNRWSCQYLKEQFYYWESKKGVISLPQNFNYNLFIDDP